MDYSRYDESTQELIKSCENLSVSGDDAAIENLDKLREIAVGLGDNNLIGHTHYYAANWYYDRAEVDKYQAHLKEAVYHLLRSSDRELLARSYNLFALEAQNNEMYDVAYHYYHMANRFAEEAESTGVSAAMLGNLAVVFYEVGDYDSAREYCRRAMELIDINEESPYYLHNKLGGYINDGLISVALRDIAAARSDCDNVKRISEEIDVFQYKEVYVTFLVFELRLLMLEGDEKGFEEEMRRLFELIEYETSHQAMVYMSDIRDLCNALIEDGRVENVEELIIALEDKVKASGATHAMRLMYEIKVDYYDAIQNEKNLDVCLREQQKLLTRQKEKRLNIYNSSTDLMSLVLDLQEEEESRRA